MQVSKWGDSLAVLLVVHTYVELSPERVAIRIISARRPAGREVRQYEEG